MATIPYASNMPGIADFDLTVWRPGEAIQENIVGAYRAIARGRERLAGRISWRDTNDHDAGRALEAWTLSMDDPRNSSEIPLREPNYLLEEDYGRHSFSYTQSTTEATVYSGFGAGAVLNKELPGYRIGCVVKHVRLNQLLQMATYHRSGDATEENNVNVRFVPFVPLQAGDVLVPASSIRIRKRTDATTESPLNFPRYGPWTFEFVEEIS